MSAHVEGGVILVLKFPVSHIFYTRRAGLYIAYIMILNQSEKFQRVYLKDKLTVFDNCRSQRNTSISAVLKVIANIKGIKDIPVAKSS